MAPTVREGRVWVDWTLDVAVSEGSAYIDEWNWKVTIERPDEPAGPLMTFEFDVWPTWG